jgi:ABC-2 type transport system permease protein
MTSQTLTQPTSRPLVDIGAMIAREGRRMLRSVDMLVTGLALPALIMCVFVIVFGGAAQRDGHYIDYVVPAILILCAGFGSAVTAVTVAKDMREGIIDRFRTMPIFGGSVLVGHVVASVLRNLVASAVVIGVAALLGYRAHADAVHWAFAALYLVFAITAFTWLCCAAGLLLSEEAASSVNFVFLFLPYVSSGFVPVDTMPAWLRGFANTEAFTPIIETMGPFSRVPPPARTDGSPSPGSAECWWRDSRAPSCCSVGGSTTDPTTHEPERRLSRWTLWIQAATSPAASRSRGGSRPTHSAGRNASSPSRESLTLPCASRTRTASVPCRCRASRPPSVSRRCRCTAT